MAVGVGLWLSTVVGALVGVGLRPLGVGYRYGQKGRELGFRMIDGVGIALTVLLS